VVRRDRTTTKGKGRTMTVQRNIGAAGIIISFSVKLRAILPSSPY
jgi:hypothetical protein